MIRDVTSQTTAAAFERDIQKSKVPPPQVGQTSKTAPLTAPRSMASLISAAGLAGDKLSFSIVSFARFFSLPLKPNVLAFIRRQVFLASQTQPSANTVSVSVKQSVANANANANDMSVLTKMREALSLAAAAAESKGVELQPKRLEVFAEAVDPDWQKRQGGERQRRRQNREPEQAEKEFLKTGVISADSLKKMFLENAEKNPLLNILNRLPGKNGQRWIVLPFDFSQDGKEYNVSMRILLEEGGISCGDVSNFRDAAFFNRAVCMALDVRIGNTGDDETEKRLFMIEAACDQAMKVTVYPQPELPQKTHFSFKSELSKLFGIPVECVFVKNSEETFPCEAACTEQLPFVDEAV